MRKGREEREGKRGGQETEEERGEEWSREGKLGEEEESWSIAIQLARRQTAAEAD